MPGKGCSSKRKHTPIVSRKQQQKFSIEREKRRKGQKGSMPSITTKELESHLKESKGKKLPNRAKKKK